MPSSSMASRPTSVALGLVEASSTITPSPSRARRPRRVMYPAFQSRRPLPKEAPDQACRWLLFLSALVFLQIYNEETHACTELQGQCPDPTTSYPQEDGSLEAAQGWKREEPWKTLTVVGGASEHQMECVVL